MTYSNEFTIWYNKKTSLINEMFSQWLTESNLQPRTILLDSTLQHPKPSSCSQYERATNLAGKR